MKPTNGRMPAGFAARLRTVCCACAVLLTARAGDAAGARHAVAGAYALGDFAVSYAIAADVAVPEVRANRSWYGDWVMLVAEHGAGRPQPFVQLGEIRGFAPHDAPSAFIAYRGSDGPVVFRRVRTLPPGVHHVAISGNARTITLAVDQALIATFPRDDFFLPGDRVYAQYAAEVADPGDAPSGYLRNLAVETDADFVPHALEAGCLRYDRGVRLDRTADGWTPTGRYRPGDPSGFRDCDAHLPTGAEQAVPDR